MEIKDRLIRIITSEGLTSSAFADFIGVQRSSISHIISGRNNPSLDFLQKILTSFPKYNAEWLIMGIGEIYKQPVQNSLYTENIPDSKPNPIKTLNNETHTHITDILTTKLTQADDQATNNIEDGVNPLYKTQKQNSIDQQQQLSKKVQRIVIFYDDKTFSDYSPDLV